MQLLIIGAILLVFLLIRIRKSYNDPVWRNMPGPQHKLPFFGLAFDLVSSDASSLHSLWAKQFGSIFRYYVIGMNTVMVSDPAVVKYVLLNNHLFDKNIFHYRYLAKALGNGLVTEWDEAKHKYHRSIVSPAFAHHHLRVLVPIFQKKGAILVEDWQKLADTNTPVSIKDYIAKATSDVIGESAFGYQLNSQRDNSPSSVYNIFAAVMGNGYDVLQAVPGVRLLTSTYYRRAAAIKKLDEQVNIMIAQKTEKRSHKAKEEEEREEEKEQKDLLDIMMDCQNEEGAMLTKAELNDQTKTFLMAGYETSSVCILWTMYLLAKHPDIQQKLADEVHRVLGKSKQPSAEDIDEMPYLYKVLRESLRFYPPIPLVVRQASEDLTLGGYNITKGTIITINIFHQHHHSPMWVDPDTFNPERWSNDESETAHLIGSYVPFIMGARNCIGSRFAMLEVRVIIAMIMQKLKFTLVPGSAPPRPIARISMVPRDPIHILFSLRE